MTTHDPYSALEQLDSPETQALLAKARQKGLLDHAPNVLRPTELGRRFLNDLLELFLDVPVGWRGREIRIIPSNSR